MEFIGREVTGPSSCSKNIVWYSMVCSTIWYGMVCSMIWYGMVCSMIWYGMVCRMIWYSMVWFVLWYGTVDSVPCKGLPLSPCYGPSLILVESVSWAPIWYVVHSLYLLVPSSAAHTRGPWENHWILLLRTGDRWGLLYCQAWRF